MTFCWCTSSLMKCSAFLRRMAVRSCNTESASMPSNDLQNSDEAWKVPLVLVMSDSIFLHASTCRATTATCDGHESIHLKNSSLPKLAAVRASTALTLSSVSVPRDRCMASSALDSHAFTSVSPEKDTGSLNWTTSSCADCMPTKLVHSSSTEKAWIPENIFRKWR